jgi:hypothetical protein
MHALIAWIYLVWIRLAYRWREGPRPSDVRK